MCSAGSRSCESRSATTKVRNTWRPIWIATYAPAKSSARSPNAPGIATAITRLANMIPSTSEPHGDRLRVEHVRHPGRVVPRPPDDEQDEHRLSRPVPRQVAEQQMRDLRDREHEDEVVEQLQVRGVLLLVARGARYRLIGRATLSIGAAGRPGNRIASVEVPGPRLRACHDERRRASPRRAARRRALGLGRRAAEARPSTSAGPASRSRRRSRRSPGSSSRTA